MHMFLSWSGKTSEKVAKRLQAWFGEFVPEFKIYFSPDTPAGSVWSEGLRSALHEAAFAVLVVTPDNREQPWLMWEAGSLCNLQPSIRVVPFLFHLDEEDIPEPLRVQQCVRYAGNEAHDKSAINALVKSMLEASDFTPSESTRVLALAAARWRELRDQLREVRPPAELDLQSLLSSTARGLACLQRRRIAALNNLGIGVYTTFISRMVEFLRQYQNPECFIYNKLQPIDYAAEVINRRPREQRSTTSEDELTALLGEVATLESTDARTSIDRELAETFPSILTIASFAAQNPGNCRRVSVLDGMRLSEHRHRKEIQFLDRLMRASDDHYLISQADAGRAVEPRREHQSDFAIWKCEEVVVVTDYYPASSTLVVSWKLPNEESPFLDYYQGVFQAVAETPSIVRISDFLRSPEASDSDPRPAP